MSKERVAVITGGAGELGLAVARRLASEGLSGALWDLDADRAKFAAASIGPTWLGVGADLTEPEEVDVARLHTYDSFGRVDVLVTCAGITGPSIPLVEYDPPTWNRVVDVNLTSVFYVCRALVPTLVASPCGRIVHISSIAGKEGNQLLSAYSAAKAGVIALTKSLGKELAHTAVRVNCVTPAMLATALLDQMTPEYVAAGKAKIPLGRFGETSEIAELVSWLSSPACSFSTGAVFDASGGRATY